MIIVRYPVTPASLPVNEDATIQAGMVVGVNTSGEVVLANDTGAGTAVTAIGLAGDDKGTSVTPTTLQNRIVDGGNETVGSGMITVYHGNGQEFWLDVYDSSTGYGVIDEESGGAIDPGSLLYSSDGGAGRLDATSTSKTAVAKILDVKGTIPTGVPGEYIPMNATARNFYLVKLLI